MSFILRSILACGIAGTFAPAHAGLFLVKAGDSLQTFLDAAVAGDVIQIEAGATFVGNFVLPNKTGRGTKPIAIRSSAMLYLTGRVTPAMAVHMPKLISPNQSPALITASGAHDYVISGLEFTTVPGVVTYATVSLGSGYERSVTDLPTNITIDRCYIHGDPSWGGTRGVALNSRRATVMNSWISDYKSTYADTQAINGFNGPGPFRIENNYLEAAGENIMFGGATSSIPNMIPSDIVIRNNTLSKPLSWRPGSQGYTDTRWVVKNHFELKNAQRVTFDRNILENCWAGAQDGSSILLTVRTEYGTMPWAVVQDVAITNNIVRRVGNGITFLGYDDDGTGVTRRITIRNNLFEEIDSVKWGGFGAFLKVVNPTANIVVEHNTVFPSRFAFYLAASTTPGFVYRNNVTTQLFCADSLGCGAAALKTSPDASVTGNLFVGSGSQSLPAGNWSPATIADVRFTDAASSNYLLATDSIYQNLGTDGTDAGVNMAALPARQ